MWHRLQNICIWNSGKRRGLEKAQGELKKKKNQKVSIWSNLTHQILGVHSMQGTLPDAEESDSQG